MKGKKRFFAILFCLVALLFAGCDNSIFQGNLGEDGISVVAMDGAKVLSKKSGYDFEAATGKYSVNYYNLFAATITNGLYTIYENPSNIYLENNELLKENVIKNLDMDGATYDVNGLDSSLGSDQYYLYDTLRYTITQVLTSSSGQKLTLDLNSAWNWTIYPNAKGSDENKGVFFANIASGVSFDENWSGIKEIQVSGNDWTNLYQTFVTNVPSFPEVYTGESVAGDEQDVIDYWNSPFYEPRGGANAAVLTQANYFQDALEYATYMIAMKYTLTDNPDFFDFQVVYNTSSGTAGYGMVTDILVGGWEDEKISVSKPQNGQDAALQRAKDLYQENGTYVGITEQNKEEIANFIKQKVIGPNAMEKQKFTVQFLLDNGTNTPQVQTSKTFNRNYDAIVKNVIDYACSQAPIAEKDGGDGYVTLDDYYLVSEITDYQGNRFFPDYGETGHEDSNNLFRDIEAREYQSLVIYPTVENIGQYINDLWLVFEYWDDPNDAQDTSGRKRLSEIVIDVGFRYFDSTAGGNGSYTMSQTVQVTLKNEQFPYDDTAADYTQNYDNHEVEFSDTGTGSDAAFGTVPINMAFKKDIGDGIINPFASINSDIATVAGDGKSATMPINSRNADYFAVVNSPNGGSFSVLNAEEKFAGANGCDFIEVYFDVHKTTQKNVNYNFKVAISNFIASEFPPNHWH